MNKLRLLAIAILTISLVLIAASILAGGSQVGLFLIFPVLISHDPMGALGILLLFVSFILLFLSISISAPPQVEEGAPESHHVRTEKKREYGGIIFIGPIPIIFGSGREILSNRWFLTAIIAIATVMLLLTFAVLFL